jgi:hypothetical protein
VCDGTTGTTGATGATGPSGTTGQSSTTFLSTSTFAVTTASPGPFFVPGLNRLINVPSGGVVYVESTGGVQTQAASELGISERVLRYKMKKYGLEGRST